MGHTNTKAKRAAIRTAVERMAWQDPTELAAVLYAAPARQVIAVLLADRHPAVHKAAVAELPPGPLGQRRRLLAIEPVTGERWVLLDECGYEWTHLYTHCRGARAGGVPAVTVTITGHRGQALADELKCWLGRREVEIETADGRRHVGTLRPERDR
jgi:hypothetical protein